MTNGDDEEQSYWDGDSVDQSAPPRTLEGGLPEWTPVGIPSEAQRNSYAEYENDQEETQ